MKTLYSLFFVLLPCFSFGQDVDTLTFYSEAFNSERTVYVHKPEFYAYCSETVEMPLIYVLDGQHEWFVNPVLSDIEYLQYTHEIPNALVVVIPHTNRNKECNITDLETELPLDRFITSELDQQLKKYHPSAFKLIIGHSFSASFSLYSYLRHADYYAGVIAHTPLDEMEKLVKAFKQTKDVNKAHISISIGGSSNHKDYHHRKKYDQLKQEHPDFFSAINTYEADQSAHNAVPVVATPFLLTKHFEDFSGRYAALAKVDLEYKLIDTPGTAEEELQKLLTASKIGPYFYPPEVAELNGIASRYWNSDYLDITTKMYELGIKYYPTYYSFYLCLYELALEKDKATAKAHLLKAEHLLNSVEGNWEGKDEVLKDIQAEKEKNGW